MADQHDRASLVLAEVATRAAQRTAVGAKVAEIRKELYADQIAVLDDPSKEIAVLGTRRAGKTELWTRVTTIAAITHPRTICRIWAINKERCRQMIWEPLKFLCARHKIECDPNNTTCTMRFPNGSEIRLLGADKDKEVEKKRGDKTLIEIVLESQLFGSYLKNLVLDVAGPCLFDLNGTFYLEGTPGPVCAGYWFAVSGNEPTRTRWISQGITVKRQEIEEILGNGWSCHHLSVLRNPFLPNAHRDLARKKAQRRWADDNPTYVREWLGRWVNDHDALYYAFDPIRNTYTQTEVQPWGPGWMHTLGWDLGAVDDMALVAWGYHPDRGELYEAYSWKKPGASMEEVMEQIELMKAKGFKFTHMFADTGGGGRMFVEQMMRRFPVNFEPAKKTEKYEHVLIFNDELRTGFVKLQRGSAYALEMAELPKDPDWPDPDKPEAPPTEAPNFPNHCCDAGLYAFRGAMHYLHREPAARVVPRSPKWYEQQEARHVKRLEDQLQKDGTKTWLERYDLSEPDWLED